MALADHTQLLGDLVPAALTADLDALSRSRALASAVLWYEREQPLEVSVSIAWAVAGVFQPAPDGWQPAWRVRELRAPGGRPLFAAGVLYGGAWVLECSECVAAGDVLDLRYARGHELSETADTIPAAHRPAVAAWAASLLCQQLATWYSAQRESAISAQVAQTETRAREFARRAQEYRGAAYAAIGRADPQAGGSASGSPTGGAAASVSAWPGRRQGGMRGLLRTGDASW